MLRFWGNYYRIIVLITGFLCLVSVCSNYIIINFTFICMKDDFSETVDVNGTVRSVYDYSPNDKKYILWAVAIGTMLGTFPVNLLYVKFGARWTFFAAGLLSGVTTLFTPWAASKGLVIFLVLRFFQGVAYSADFAAIGVIIAKWAPLKETAIFIATLTSFTSLSSIVTNSASGVICASSLGWKWSFYLHSIVSFLVFATWLMVYSDNPGKHKMVSKKEFSRIQKDKSAAHLDENISVPYIKIFTSPVILTVWLCAFTELSTLILITTYSPIYLRSVLGFDVAEIGFYLGIVTSIHLPFRFVCAILSDKTRCISEKSKIQVFNTLAVGFVGISFIIFGYIPSDHRFLALTTLAILECFISFNCGGFYKCGTLHSRQFASVVISTIQFTKCVALFSGPALVAYFVNDETNRSEWIHVFLTMAVLMFAANSLAFVFFTEKPAEWTKEIMPSVTFDGKSEKVRV